MGRSDTPPGRLALAPSAQPIRGPGERPAGRAPVREPPSPPPANYGRRRLLVLAIVVTILAVGYFAVTSLTGGGGGGAGDDPYLDANHKIAAEGAAIVQAGTDLRTLRDVGKFSRAVDASIAAINTQIATLNRLAANHTGKALSTVHDTVASADQLTQLGATFEHEVTKGQLGPANRDEAAINVQLAALQQQADAWNKL